MTLLSISAPAEQSVRSPANVLMVSSEQKHNIVFLCESSWVRCHHNSCPGVVDCRNLGLTRVPSDIPHDTVELWEKYSRRKNILSSKNIPPSSGGLRIIRSPRLGRMHFRPQSNWRECKSWAMNDILAEEGDQSHLTRENKSQPSDFCVRTILTPCCYQRPVTKQVEECLRPGLRQ